MNTLGDLYTKLDRNHDYTAADAELLTGGNIVLVQDPDGAWQPFVIRQPLTELSDTLTKTIQADHLCYELGFGQPRNYNMSDTPGVVIAAALDGTRWQAGTIAPSLQSRTATLVAIMASPLKFLRQIESKFGGRLRFRCEIDGHQVTGLYVDLLEVDTEFSGQRFEFGHNLDDIKILADYSNTVTALVGTALGRELDPETGEVVPLTFAEAEWHKASGDPADKPYGQTWVGDEQARLHYGIPDGQGNILHRYGIHESQAETPEELLQGTWTVLQRNNRPHVTVQARVADLEQVSIVDIETGEPVQLSHEKIRLGNICHILARDKGIIADLAVRVIQIIRPLKSPELTQVEFGDPVPLQSRKVKELEDWQSWANRRGGIWNKARAFNNDLSLDVATSEIRREGQALVGSSGVLSIFQYVSVGIASFNDTGGWSNFGLESGPFIIPGRAIVSVHIPSTFEILSATVELIAAPTYYSNPGWPAGGEHETKWKQSRNLCLYQGDFEQGAFWVVPDSGTAFLSFGDGDNITQPVLGMSSWSPTLAYDGDDPNNKQNVTQHIVGDISKYLIAGQTAVFFVQTTDFPTPENFKHNQGLGKVVVTVKGYAR